jgi:hypothetical protein
MRPSDWKEEADLSSTWPEGILLSTYHFHWYILSGFPFPILLFETNAEC